MNSAWSGEGRFYPNPNIRHLAQIYIDAEERALAADGDVLDDFDVEVEADDAIADFREGEDDRFKSILEAQ